MSPPVYSPAMVVALLNVKKCLEGKENEYCYLILLSEGSEKGEQWRDALWVQHTSAGTYMCPGGLSPNIGTLLKN